MYIRILLAVLFLSVPVAAETTDTLITDLRLLLDQTDSTTGNTNWSNDNLRRYLNMAQEVLAPHSGGVQKADTVPGSITPRIPLDSLSSDFVSLKGMIWLMRDTKENTPIPFVPLDSFYRTVRNNTKQTMGLDNFVVTEDAGEIAVFTEVSDEDSLLISYYAYPSVLSDSQECDFDRGWEKVLLYTAAWMAFAGNRDQFWMQWYSLKADSQMVSLRALTTRKPQLQTVP